MNDSKIKQNNIARHRHNESVNARRKATWADRDRLGAWIDGLKNRLPSEREEITEWEIALRQEMGGSLYYVGKNRNKATRHHVQQLTSQRMPVREIAQKLNIHISTVYRSL